MTNLPQAAAAAAARSRELARRLRDVEPSPPDWDREREARAETKATMQLELRPGVRIEHLDDGTSEVTALADRKPLFHTFIAKGRSQRAKLVLRELIRAFQILMVDFTEHYDDHDYVVIGTEPND